jgi:lipid A 3-O-deacylase
MFSMLLQVKISIASFAATIFCLNISAQLIDNTSTFRNVNTKSYFRFHYDNDFFTNTDYYYSQGITLEYVHPSLKHFPMAKLLYKPKKGDTKYGISFNLFGYTPTSTNSNAILYGDRPFEGSMSLKMFAISSSSAKQQQVSAAIHLGIIGPAALGEEIQTNIHRWTGNKLPIGWQHQIKNDIILNYQLNIEKKLLVTDAFLLNGVAELRAGTLHDRIGGGINFMTGHFNNPYKTEKEKKVQYYLYGQSRINLIGYDGTMQGGIFNRKSTYTISSADVSGITFQADAGIVLNFQKLFLGYNQSFLSKEFTTGKTHRWGGVSLGVAF